MQGNVTLTKSETPLFSTPDPLNTVLHLTIAPTYKLIHITHKQLTHGHLWIYVSLREQICTGHDPRIWS